MKRYKIDWSPNWDPDEFRLIDIENSHVLAEREQPKEWMKYINIDTSTIQLSENIVEIFGKPYGVPDDMIAMEIIAYMAIIEHQEASRAFAAYFVNQVPLLTEVVGYKYKLN